jgi:hypothetical protein
MLQFILDALRQRFHSVLRTAATARAGNLTGTTQPVFNDQSGVNPVTASPPPLGLAVAARAAS